MQNRNRIILALTAVLLLVGAYFVYASKQQTDNPVSHGSSEASYVAVVDGLRQKFGPSAVQPVEMDLIDPATQSLGSKQRVKVVNESVDVWEYAGASETNTKAGTISSDGSGIGGTQVEWTSSSHWYKKDKVLVLYLGNDKEVISSLNTILGKQFAGSNF
jgi:hypothetical protein